MSPCIHLRQADSFRDGFWGSVQLPLDGIHMRLIRNTLLLVSHRKGAEGSRKTGITMAKTDFKSVDEYIASQPETVQGILGRVRSTIRKAVPGAEEVISYKIPTYKLNSGAVL